MVLVFIYCSFGFVLRRPYQAYAGKEKYNRQNTNYYKYSYVAAVIDHTKAGVN